MLNSYCDIVDINFHTFLTLALEEMCGQFHTPATLHPRKEPQYPMDRRLHGDFANKSFFFFFFKLNLKIDVR